MHLRTYGDMGMTFRKAGMNAGSTGRVMVMTGGVGRIARTIGGMTGAMTVGTMGVAEAPRRQG
jgi:hypothetical protein